MSERSQNVDLNTTAINLMQFLLCHLPYFPPTGFCLKYHPGLPTLPFPLSLHSQV